MLVEDDHVSKVIMTLHGQEEGKLSVFNLPGGTRRSAIFRSLRQSDQKVVDLDIVDNILSRAIIKKSRVFVVFWAPWLTRPAVPCNQLACADHEISHRPDVSVKAVTILFHLPSTCF
jgi:hypothetical protein